MKRYANLSDRSGVVSYDYDATSYSYITVKFKDGSIYTYTTASNGLSTIMDMIGRGNLGVGLNRYINKYEPSYIKGEYKPIDTTSTANTVVTKVFYPLGNIKKVEWNDGKNWVKITYNNGDIKTYTEESCGVRNISNIIKKAKEGYGLWSYLQEERPLSVEEVI